MPDSESSVVADPFERAFSIIAASTQAAIGRMRDEVTSLRTELATARAEQRSAVVATPVAAVEVREGPAGRDGKDGADGKDAVVDVDSIVARVTDGVLVRVLEKIPAPVKGERGEPGISGKDGERGADGLSSPEEIRALAEDEARKVVLMQQRGFNKGVFRQGENYRTADGVTWDGSFWFATRDTSAKPGTDESWQLAVKRGRDAKK